MSATLAPPLGSDDAESIRAPSVARLDPAEVAALGRPSVLRGAAHVVLEWGLVLVVAAAASSVGSPWAVVAAVPVIAARQHALVALAHEGAHGRLFPIRGRRGSFWNLLLTEVLVAWPLFVSTRAYRRTHLAHHRALSTEDDPDWVRNRPDLWRPAEWRAVRTADRPSWAARARHLLGLHRGQAGLFEMFRGGAARSAEERRWAGARAAHAAALVVAITALGAWPLVPTFWFLPLFTWFLVLMRVRGWAEHWAVEDAGPLDSTRTLLVGPLARALFVPKNIHYHLEHHLYPSVPFHALPDLHARLMRDPEYRRRAHVTRGLCGLARELAGRPDGAGSDSARAT